jgi:RNA polymerase sigma-70 factor (ECF subfamily)
MASVFSPSPEKADLSSADDRVLLKRAKEDPEVFGILMERYEQPLRRYLMRLTGWGEEEISDILQESFIKAYRHLNEYDEDLKFSTWMYRITHNQAVDVLRKSNRQKNVSDAPFEEIAAFVPAETNIEAEFLRQEDLQKIRQAILALPLVYREVLVLRFLEERSYEEIVDIVKKPKGTVATLIRRGREMLLKYINHLE